MLTIQSYLHPLTQKRARRRRSPRNRCLEPSDTVTDHSAPRTTGLSKSHTIGGSGSISKAQCFPNPECRVIFPRYCLFITVEVSSPGSNPKPAPGQHQRLLCSTSTQLSKRDEPELRELERSEIAMTRTNGKTDKKMYSHPEIFSSHGQCCGQQGCVEIPLGPGTAVSCCLLFCA